MPHSKPVVAVIMGSDSDFDIMKESVKILKQFNVPVNVQVSSAHRTPERTAAFASSAREQGFQTIIVGAGAAAHLAGVIAAHTTLPVIAVPIDATSMRGLDALLSTVQMPGGIPVATMAIGKAGAKNAALFAVELLSLTDSTLKDALDRYRADSQASVQKKSDAIAKEAEQI